MDITLPIEPDVIFNVTLVTVTSNEPAPFFLPDLILRGGLDGFVSG
jgi:hypothetical protein